MAAIYTVDESFDPSVFEGASCAFGVFDGVHVGHRFLINATKDTASNSGGKSLVLTFDIDPDEVFRPNELKKLMTNEQRIAMLASTGVDGVVVLPFTSRFAALAPSDFLSATFADRFPAYLHVGSDFRFGFHASGTVEDLRAWGRQVGTQIAAHELKSEDGVPVTATRIRGLLAEGSIEDANRLLDRPYFVTGAVQSGRGEGADMGFRTANLLVSEELRVLGNGVYAAYAWVDGRRYKAAVNVGVAATFADVATATVEAHLLDFDGDIYGRTIKVEYMNWLRPNRPFDSVEELIATVQGNIAWVRENL